MLAQKIFKITPYFSLNMLPTSQVPHKLILLLQQFSSEKLQGLRLFIDSPYFNTYKKISQLVHYLCDLAPEWQANMYEDATIFGYLYGKDATFDKKRLADLRSDTFRLVEQFLAQEALNINNIEFHRGLFQYYYTSDNLANYQQLVKKMEQHLQATEHANSQLYYYKFLLAESKWGISTKYSQREKREKSLLAQQTQAQEVCDAFDVFYFIRKMEMSLVQLNMEGVVKTQFQYHLLDEILQHIESQAELQQVPLLNVYYLAVRMFRFEDELAFFALKTCLIQQASQFELWDIRNLSNALLNFCMKRVSESDNWKKERMEITLLQVEKGWVYNDSGNIPGPLFINVLTVALKMDLQRAQSFIQENIHKLPQGIQENMQNYCDALIAFETQNYKETIRLLNLRQITDDIYIEIRSQRLLIKAYFEAENPAIENALNTFKSYIAYSQVLTADKKAENDNFRKLLTQVLNAFTPSKKTQLKSKILSTSQLVEKEWLLNKLKSVGV